MSEMDFEIVARPASVEFWSTVRLPFEAKRWLRGARQALRDGLGVLVAGDDQILAAEYVSDDSSLFDVENVLFYNVGASVFRAATPNGLVFRRSLVVPLPSPSGRVFPHYHRYEFESLARRSSFGEGVCHFEFELDRLSSSTKPHEVWWPAVRAEASGSGSSVVNGPFGLEVLVRAPAQPMNVAGLLKPLADGVVSALHSQTQPQSNAIGRLSRALGAPVNDVKRTLASPVCPLLGERELVRAYRQFVQWNPADERCEYLRLVVETWPREKFSCRVDVLVPSVERSQFGR